jgi:hypothetical protein
VVEIDPAGQAWVDFPGNAAGPVLACSVIQILVTAAEQWIGRRVVLVMEADAEMPPVILGAVHDAFVREETPEANDASSNAAGQIMIERKLRLVGQDQISLECGRSSLTMRKDGKIVIKGEQIVSRATGTNRIKGGTVAIN